MSFSPRTKTDQKPVSPPVPALSPRLALIASKVPPGSRVADIGCGPAKLCAWLALSGISPSVLALDVAEGPLDTARETFAAYRCDREVTIRLSRGFSHVGAGEFDCAVIAGMGGETIAQILAQMPYTPPAGSLYILQPMTRDEQLRVFLASAGYEITDEDLVRDRRRIYVVMTVRYTGVSRRISLEQAVLGSLPAAHPLWQDYRDSCLRRLKKEYDGLGSAKCGNGERYLQIENILHENMFIME